MIEQNEQLIADNEHEISFLKGSVLKDDNLLAAGIQRGKNLIRALPDDADNLFVVLSARQLKPEMDIMNRFSEDKNQFRRKPLIINSMQANCAWKLRVTKKLNQMFQLD